ncbi:MAG TPA: hypothetical protein VFF07_04215 [Actinomycetota bacterium]|nr:hypothetical protein [Actinomycetota bacterium]
MATEERARQALYARLEEVIGDDHAATLMQYLPPDPSDLATKSDLRELRTGVDQRMDGLHQRMGRMERHMERFDDRLPDLRSAVREQTRVLVATSVGTMTTLSIVVFAAARLI